MRRPQHAILALLAVAGLACVDATGTSGAQDPGTTATNTNAADLSGVWNATLYTMTSKANSATTTDLILTNYTVLLTIGAGGHVVRTITGGGSAVTDTGTVLVTGSDMNLTMAGKLATGTVSRNNKTMTLDLAGAGVLWDFDHDGVGELASLHAKFVQG